MITNLYLEDLYASIQDDYWVIVESDNSTDPDFKYVIDVYVNSVLLIRAKIYPNPADNLGYFDISKILSSQISYDWFVPVAYTNNSYVVSNQKNHLDFRVEVGEDIAGVTTTNMANQDWQAYNWVPSLLNRRNAYQFSNGPRWLTSRPLKHTLCLQDKLYVPFFTDNNSGTMSLRVASYYFDGSLRTSVTMEYSYGLQESFVQLEIGPQTIIDNQGGILNPITSAVWYYTIQPLVNGDEVGDKFYVYLDCCNDHSANLYFMNRFGYYDTARFKLENKLMMDVERKSYNDAPYRFDDENFKTKYSDDNGVYYESKINYYQKMNWTYKLSMNYPTDKDFEWLEELIYSPQIFMEYKGEIFPVTIKNTTHEYFRQSYSGLKTFDIEVEVNQKRQSFRR
jgi:hypothetical protein